MEPSGERPIGGLEDVLIGVLAHLQDRVWVEPVGHPAGVSVVRATHRRATRAGRSNVRSRPGRVNGPHDPGPHHARAVAAQRSDSGRRRPTTARRGRRRAARPGPAAQDDVPAPAARPPPDERRRRTDDRDVGVALGGAAPGAGRPPRGALRSAAAASSSADRQLDEPTERRRAEPAPDLELGVVERAGVAGRDRLDRRMVRLVALDDRAAGPIAATGPTDGLGEELVRPLRGPLVGQVEGDVGADDADEGHLRDVEALGHQARADEDVEPAVAERIDDPLGGALALDDVAVEPADPEPAGSARGPRARPARCRRRGSGSGARRRPGSAPAIGAAVPQWWQRSDPPAAW